MDQQDTFSSPEILSAIRASNTATTAVLEYVTAEPKRQAEMLSELRRTAEAVARDLPATAEIVGKAIADLPADVRIMGQSTGDYSNEGQAIGAVAGAAAGAVLGGGIPGAALGAVLGGGIGKAIGERIRYRLP